MLEKQISVNGFLGRNWPDVNDGTPAVIVNPAAQPLDLLAWCLGEVNSLQAVLDALASSETPIEPSELSGIFLHRIEPLGKVLYAAVTVLVEQKRSTSGGEA